MDKQARREPTVGSVWEAGPWRAEVKGEAISSQWPCKVWLNGAQQADGMVSLDWFHKIARYVRGPEAAEPAPWKVGQRRRGAQRNASDELLQAGYQPPQEFTVKALDESNWGNGEPTWMVTRADGHEWWFKESWPSELLQDVAPSLQPEPWHEKLTREVETAMRKVGESMHREVTGIKCRICPQEATALSSRRDPVCAACLKRLTDGPEAGMFVRPCCGLAASDCECPKALPMDELEKHIMNVRPAVIAKPYHLDHHCEPCLAKGIVTRETVKQRWCQSLDGEGNKLGAELEWTCDACHLLDEAEFAEKTREAQAKRYEPEPRYDARQLLAPGGLGPDVLCCPVRGVRGPR